MLPPFDPWLGATIAADVVAAGRSDAPGLAARREQRLALLLKAAQRAPFHAERLKHHDPAHTRLSDLPVCPKAELMANFEDALTDPRLRLDALRRFVAQPACIGEAFANRYVVWESSGSSGEPALFVQDVQAMAVYDALEALRRPGRGWLNPFGERVVFVGATSGHFASIVSVERLRRLNPLLARTLGSVSFLQPVQRIASQLNALAPTVVATYPSAALLLAEEQRAGRLRIAPREMWTGGETLTPSARRFIAQAFGCTVSNSYGASEFLALASECRLGRLHLNSDWVILESVDAQGRHVPAGTLGAATWLTNLANHVQPLIRYELGDRVRFASHRCPCGSALPVIEVEGRCDDTLTLAGGVRLLPLALTTVLEDDAGLFDFQLVQRGANELLLRCGGEVCEAQREGARLALLHYLESQGARGVHIECRCEPSAIGRSGKRQRVVSA